MGRITLHGVRKAFGETEVIPPLDLEIEDGEFVVFVGPSGCGKSTLAAPDRGARGRLGGRDPHRRDRPATDLPPAKRGLAMVFQSYALYPHMSVRKNIAFPMRMAGIDKAEQERRIAKAAAGAQPHRLPRPQARPALGRPAPARRHRARDRARARRLPLRRAAVEPRRGAARRHEDGDRRAAQPARHHHGLRHPRPGRGDDHGRQDRGAARRPDRAGGLAARPLPRAAQPLRRGLHRLAQDEPARGGGGARARGTHRGHPA